MDYTILDKEEGKEVRFSRIEDIGKIVIEIIDPEVDCVYWNHIEIDEQEFARLFTLFDITRDRGVTDHVNDLGRVDK